MRAIVHTRHGPADAVLAPVERAAPDAPPPGSALVRVRLVPIHRGDLQAVAASPAYGEPQPIPEGGRVPGLEGVGTIEALAADVDPALGLNPGLRVAFFPVPGTWAERVVASAASLVPIGDAVADETAANFLVDVLTARSVVRAGHDLLPDAHKARTDVTVIQTGAASAVGRLITADLLRRGVKAIRLVRTRESAERLEAILPGAPVLATESPDWRAAARREAAPSKVYVALDGVGGDLLGDVAGLVETGGGIVSYGVLGGGQADIRPFVPRRLTLKGVSVVSWLDAPEAVRREDVTAALELARGRPELFPVAATFRPDRIREAAAALDRPGRTGAVLVDFR